jgi:hypothetical protein
VRSTLVMSSTSRAQDAGYHALADIAAVASSLGVEYRIVGGHMVSLLVEAYEAVRAPARETADADVAVPFQVLGDPRLVAALMAQGYGRRAGNRFARQGPDGLDLVVDLLAPSYTGTHNPNQQIGDLVVDEIPGLSLALSAAPTVLLLDIDLFSGERREAVVPVPGPVPALALKALAYRSRLAPKDALDVWRLLEVAAVARISPDEWAGGGVRRDARQILHHPFGARTVPGSRTASTTSATRTRIAVLVQAHVLKP